MTPPPIEQAIQQTERYIAQLDEQLQRAATRTAERRTAAARARWGARLAFLSQARENSVYLLNGLMAIRNRPELQNVPPAVMAKAQLREPVRRRA